MPNYLPIRFQNQLVNSSDVTRSRNTSEMDNSLEIELLNQTKTDCIVSKDEHITIDCGIH